MAEPDKQGAAGGAAGWGPVGDAGTPGPGQAPWPPTPDIPGVDAPGAGVPGAGVPGVGEPLPSALAPPPPLILSAEAAPARSTSLKPLLLICALSVASASICAGVILYARGERGPATSASPQGDDRPSALPGEAMPPVITTADPGAAAAPNPGSAATPTPGKTVRAVVSLPAGQPRAVLRNKPAFEGDVVIFLPTGTAVEITNSTTAAGGTWFRVKTIDFQPPASGWVHGAILKMQ